MENQSKIVGPDMLCPKPVSSLSLNVASFKICSVISVSSRADHFFG